MSEEGRLKNSMLWPGACAFMKEDFGDFSAYTGLRVYSPTHVYSPTSPEGKQRWTVCGQMGTNNLIESQVEESKLFPLLGWTPVRTPVCELISRLRKDTEVIPRYQIDFNPEMHIEPASNEKGEPRVKLIVPGSADRLGRLIVTSHNQTNKPICENPFLRWELKWISEEEGAPIKQDGEALEVRNGQYLLDPVESPGANTACGDTLDPPLNPYHGRIIVAKNVENIVKALNSRRTLVEKNIPIPTRWFKKINPHLFQQGREKWYYHNNSNALVPKSEY